MKLFRTILKYIFPEICISCGTEGNIICSKCTKLIIYKKSQECPYCRQKNNDGHCCKHNCVKKFFFDQLLVATSYKRNLIIQKLIKEYKYRNKKGLSIFFSNLILKKFENDFLKKFIIGDVFITSVPISKEKLKARAYNQAELIAKNLSNTINIKYINTLKWTNYKGQQAGLKKADRVKSRAFTMGIISSNVSFVRHKNIILIDDIASTCSTINECSRVLKLYGALSVCVVVISRN